MFLFPIEEMVCSTTNTTDHDKTTGLVVLDDATVDCNLDTTPKLPRRTRGAGRCKLKLAELDSNYSRERRLQPIVTSLLKPIEVHCKDLKDIWPYLGIFFNVDGGFTDNTNLYM